MANLLESMLKGQGGGEYKNMAKEKYLMLSERLFLMNNKDIMKNCLKILIKVTENIIKSNGEDPKFLCLKMSSTTVSKRIIGVTGGQEFLHALGFIKVRDTTSSAFILEKKDVDIEHLKKCKEWISNFNSSNDNNNNNNNDDCVVVQIRQLNGRGLIAPFYLNENIQDIYDFVLNFRTDGGRGEFILCTSYPVIEYKTTEHLALTIKTLCNNPNGTKNNKKLNLMIKKSNLTADNGAFLNGGDNSNSTAFNEQLKLQQAYSERRASRIAEQKQLKQDRNKALQAFKEDREEALLKQQRQKAAEEYRQKVERERIEKYNQSLLNNKNNTEKDGEGDDKNDSNDT